MSRMRAVENGRWVVNAAVSGISAFIDPSGRVVAEVGLFRTAILRHTIRSSDVVTPYVRWGDWFPWLSLVIVAGMVLVPRKRTGVRGVPGPAVAGPSPDPRHPADVRGARHDRMGARSPARPSGARGRPGRRRLVARRHRTARRRPCRPTSPGCGCSSVPGSRGSRARTWTGSGSASPTGTTCSSRWTPTSRTSRRSSPRLLEAAASGRDLVVGSRYVPGGSVTDWSRSRVALSKAGNALRAPDARGADPRRDQRLPRLPPRGAHGARRSARSTPTATGSRSSW